MTDISFSGKHVVLVVAAGTLLSGLIFFYVTKKKVPIRAVASLSDAGQKRLVGGVERSVTDRVVPVEAQEFISEARRFQEESKPRGRLVDHLDDYPVLRKEMNPNVRSVIEAIESRSHPERLNPMFQPRQFDEGAFRSDPQAYLDVIEPGRVFLSAQPRNGVASIGVVGRRRKSIRQKESVRLAVRVPPGAPVTFTSMDLGEFSNRLPSINVLADKSGVASASFTGTEGTTDEVNILAASPMASSRAHFIVTILEH
ncbi:hypothetical protein U8335_13650 [Roseiconus lacunae]|uniref:hypothetical protein n=1 Tax=Roseiconus lacunae TaxID=2605694 RepID=UPI003091B1D1|nr:hypothetical protein U8335_13650 [Stieleria sp. HD01]